MTAFIEFNQGNYRIVEDGTAVGLEVTLVRSGDTTGTSDVTVDFVWSGPASPADFNGTIPIPISFAANETSKTVTIPVFDDFDPEGIEKFVLFLTNPSWGTEIGGQGAATLEIIDNDSSPIVEFDAASYSVNENDGSVTIGLTRVGDTSGSSDVNIFWGDGSAINGSDYLPSISSIQFAPNQTSTTVNVPIIDDGDSEGTEIFFADFGLYPSGVTIGNQAQATIEIVDNDGPTIVELSSGSYSVSENAGMATVALTRTGDTSSFSSVEIALYGGTATSGVDFSSPASSLVNFAANQSSATVDIPITDDFDLEGQESLFLSLLNPSGGSYIGLQNTATLDIIDNDGQPILELDSSSYSVSEADGLAVATINRSGDIGSSSSVEVLLTDGSATRGWDFYSPPSTTVNFAANQSSATVLIPIVEDYLSEPTEDFTLSLVNPSNGIIGLQDAATVEIVDSSGYSGYPIIEFDSASYSGSEQDGVALFTLKRSGYSSGPLSVDVQYVDGTASASYDINLFNTTINFAQNQSSVTSGILINDDFETEITENLTLVLTNPYGADLGYQSTANLDIIDNDGFAKVEFDAASYSVGENGGIATVRVNRTGDTSASSTVEVLLSDRSATNGSDYSNPIGSAVNFAPHQTSATVVIPIAEDIDIEGTEELALNLANPDAVTNIGKQGSATLEIVDNDGPAIVEFASASYSGSEDSAVATVLVTRSGDTSNPSTIGLLLSDGTAEATFDVYFPLPTATIDFAANQTSATVDIPIYDDYDNEDTENLFLSLIDPSPGSYVGSQSNATLEIIDNDSSPIVEFDSLSHSVAENEGYAVLNLTRTGDVSSSSSVNVSLWDGSASGYSDFDNLSGSILINFNPHQTSAAVVIPIYDDAEIEGTENFFVNVVNQGGGITYATTATVEIVDNDGPEIVEFASGSYSASEGDGLATIELKRSGDTSFSASAVELFLYDGTALANADVNTPPSIPVNFAANQTSTTVTIPVIDDAEIEGKESLLLSLGSSGIHIGNQGTATLDIIDNDGVSVVELDSVSYSVNEGDGVAVATINRTGDISSESTVNLLLTDGSATESQDFHQPWSSSIQFAANQSSATVLIPITDDAYIEGTENFLLSLDNPSTGTIGSQNTATVEIVDNDSSPLVAFDAAIYSGRESDGGVWIDVTRTGDLTYSSTVDVSLRNGSASSIYGDFDFYQNISINFAPYQTSATFGVGFNDDPEIEGTESFFVDMVDRYSPISSTATVEIIDDDGPGVVEFASESYSASEYDGVATIELKRSGDISFSSGVELFLYDRTALANFDVNFTPPSIPVNFAANQTTTKVTIPVIDDFEVEGTENLLLTLANPAAGTNVGSQGTATLDIIDNDGGPVVELESASYSINEGDGVAVATINRTGDISSESTVNLLLSDGSATNGQDFHPPWSSSIRFAANQSSATVLIPITDDADTEGTENFLLSLDSSSTGTIGSQSTATVEITDNDAPPVVEFESASYSVNENGAAALVTLKRTGGDMSWGIQAEVGLIEGTADFNDVEYSSTYPITQVSFAPGQDSTTVPIYLYDDSHVEGTEYLTLGTGDSSINPSGIIRGAQSLASLEIIDDDSPTVVEFEAASYSIAENGGAATIKVKRSGDIRFGSSVELLLSDRSATNFSDFNNPISNIIDFAANQASATVVIPITDDFDLEGTEDLALELVNPTGGNNIGTQGTAILEIVDNDGPSVVEFAAASYSVAENSGLTTIHLTREGDTNNPSTVELLLSNGSATNGSDFNNPASNIVEFVANQTSATVYVPILEDFDVEGKEELTLELVNPSGGTNIGTQGTASLEIVDNDGPAIVEFAAASYETTENGGTATIDLTRSGDVSSSFLVEITVSGGSATSSVDFSPAPYILYFETNQTSTTLFIPILDDADSEGLEDVILELVNPSGGSNIGTQSTTTLEILDDENALPEISLPGTPLDYIENSAPAVIDSSATVADANSSDFDGGTLTVSLSSGGTADDRLSIQDQGISPGEIGLSGSDVTYEGTPIGSFSGGIGSADLVVTFNANSSPAATQALVRNIAYENVSENPAIANRMVEFILTDGDGGTSSAVTQSVRVQAVNDAPAISPVNLSGDEDTDIAFAAADFTNAFSDIEGESLVQVKITSLSADGTLKLNGTAIVANQEIVAADLGNLTFTPATNFNGSTSFDWNASDGSDYSPAAAVNLTVNPVNDAPTVSTVSLSAAEDTDTIAFTAADFSNGFGDPESDSLAKIKITSLPDSGTLALSGTEVTANQEIDAADLGNLVFTAAANFSGTTSFAWNGSDGTSYGAADAEVILAIAFNNDLPEVSNVSLSQDEDTDLALTAADFTNAFSDLNDDSLAKIKITSLADSGTLALSGTAVTANQEIDAADFGNLVFTPAANFNGSTSFGWNGFDGIAYAAQEATVSVTVNPINDAPVLGLVAISGDEDAEVGFSSENFSSHFSDAEGGSLAKVKISSLPADGTLTLDGTAVSENQEIEPSELGNLVFTPTANFNGTASFGWNGSDGIAYAATEGTVSITVNPLADLPTVSNFGVSGDEDANIALSSQDFSANFSDPDGESLAKIQITSLPQNGSLKLDGTAVTANLEIDAADLDNLVFAPAANWNGSTSFGWNGSDGTGYAETEATANLTVNAVNNAPIAGEIASQITLKDRSFQFQFAENIFSDIDGDSLSYSAATPAWLSFDPSSRTFSGTPSSSDAGTQVIEVTASDGQDTASTSFELTVIEFNNPPVVANSVFSQNLGYHNNGQFSFAADTYVDPDPGDTITYSIALANTLRYSWYDSGYDTNGRWYRKAKEGIVFPEVEMPSWLSFDPETRTVTIDEANRPTRFRYGVKVTGTDRFGASTSEFIWFKSSTLGGFIIDNYIAGATVFWDANKNGIQDAGEPSTTSDQTGEFDLDVAIEDYDANNNGILDPEEGQIVAFGGIDTATGLPLETPVTATPESTVVTLLTTLVTDLVDKGLTVNEANERVAAALSLPSGVDINSLDPIAATENNEVGGTETLAAMVKVQNVITQTAASIDGVSNADFNVIVGNVVGAITSQIQTGVTLDVSEPQVLETIIKDAAGATQQDDANIDLVQVEAIASQVAQVMAESNQQIDAAVASGASGTNLTTSIANIQKVTLDGVVQDLEDAAQGTKEIAQVVAENTGSALEAKIASLSPSSSNAPSLPSVPTLGANIELVRNDATEGTDGDDTYIGDDRDNSYLAYSGNDVLFGNSGNDWMNGNRGDDSLDGGEGDDTLYGGKNNDSLSGNNGADVIFGNRGNDTLFGNDGDDFLNGNQAEDQLFGGNGNDMLYGGKQNDTLTGGDGSDTLSGDFGNDILAGGDGSDWFVLKQGYGSDVLTDFEDGQDFLALANGLTFQQLAITSENGATLIRVEGELLATLENVDASLIDSSDFLAFS